MASILFNIARICNSQLKCNYLKKEKLFLNFLFHFWNLHQILNILRKNVMVIANIFQKLETPKNLVRPFCKKRRFGTRSYSQDVKVCQILAKSTWACFYQVFSSFWENLIWRRSPLVLGKILSVFVNTLTADGKYHIQDWGNFPLPIQTQLSEKRKKIFSIFSSISGIYINF